MFVIVGWLVALGCIFGVFIVHGGNIGVVLKALAVRDDRRSWARRIGAFVANNQPKVLKATLAGLGMCFKGSKYTKARYMELMALLYDILQKARKEGLMAIENDVEEPARLAAVQEVRDRRQRPPRGRVHHRLPAHDGLGQPQRARDRDR